MNKIEKKLVAAQKLTYDVHNDELYADDILIGRATDFSRRAMLKRADVSWHEDSDECLFDALVETI